VDSKKETTYQMRIAKYAIVFLFVYICTLILFSSDIFQTRAGSLNVSHSGDTQYLIGHWTFDGINTDWTTNITSDKSSNGNHGTLVSLATTTAPVFGKLGQAFIFDGTNDKVVITDPDLVESLASFTLSFWIKSEVGLKSADDPIVVQTGAGNDAFSLIWDSNENVNFNVYDTGNTLFTASYTDGITDTEWHHVVGVLDGQANLMFVYVDGVVGDTTDAFTDVVNTTTNDLVIGPESGSGNQVVIDDVRLYNTAFSQADVLEMYNNSSSKFSFSKKDLVSNGLIAYWTFDGGDMVGGAIQDVSGQGNHGVLSNIATSTLYIRGHIGQGLNFDGLNDIALFGSGTSNIFDASSPLSVSFWMKAASVGESNNGAIIGKSSDDYTNGWIIQLGSNNLLQFGIDYTTTDLLVQTVNSTVSLDEWDHYIVTWDGTTSASNVHIYKNGSEVSYQTTTDGSGSRVSDASYEMAIGNSNAGTKTFDGVLDDIRVFNTVISADDIHLLSGTTTFGPHGAGIIPVSSGMTWVFLGDSITDAQEYTAYLESYFHLKYPAYDMHFRGEGRGGSTIPEVTDQGRYDRRVYAWDPDIVTVMFGHNGSFTTDEFKDDMVELVDLYIDVKNKAEPILFGPHPKYTATGDTDLKADSVEVVNVATSRGWLSADTWAELFPYIASNIASSSPVDFGYDADTIHPGPAGHLGIAYAILKDLGEGGIVSSTTIDATAPAVLSSEYTTISNLTTNAYNGVDFTRLDDRLPMTVDDLALDILPLMPEVLDINQYMLTITGLSAGNYDVYIDGTLSASTTAAILASGWNMWPMTQGPIYDQLKEVLGRIRDKEGVGRLTLTKTGPPYTGVTKYRSNADNGYNNLGLRGETLKTYINSLGSIQETLALDALIHSQAEPVSRSFSLRKI